MTISGGGCHAFERFARKHADDQYSTCFAEGPESMAPHGTQWLVHCSVGVLYRGVMASVASLAKGSQLENRVPVAAGPAHAKLLLDQGIGQLGAADSVRVDRI